MARVIALREALNEAMVEEMRRDPDVFLMGEEVAEYNGAYKVSKGMLDEFGEERGAVHFELRLCGVIVAGEFLKREHVNAT